MNFCLKFKISWTYEDLFFSFFLSLSLFFQQPLELTRKILRDKQNKKNAGQPIPVFPSWVYERPALIGDFLIGTSLSTDTMVPIGMWYAGKIALTLCVLYLFRSAVQISSHSGWKQNLAPCTLQMKIRVQKNKNKNKPQTYFVRSVFPVLNISPTVDPWDLICFEFPSPFSLVSHSLHKIYCRSIASVFSAEKSVVAPDEGVFISPTSSISSRVLWGYVSSKLRSICSFTYNRTNGEGLLPCFTR